MLEKLMQSPIAWAVLSIVTIISLPIAIYSIVTSKKRKEFSYVGRTYGIVEKGKKKLEKMELLYNGQSISDISITQYAIWNSGNQLLNRSDIVETSPLRLSVKESGKILDAHIITECEESNKFEIEVSEDVVKIDFDYVAENEGIVLQVIHTGPKSNLAMECKIKGGNPIKCKNQKPARSGRKRLSRRIRRKVAAGLLGVMSVGMLLYGLLLLLGGIGVFPIDLGVELGLYPSKEITAKELTMMGTMMFLTGVLYAGTFGHMIINVFGIGIPQKLRVYAENNYYD